MDETAVYAERAFHETSKDLSALGKRFQAVVPSQTVQHESVPQFINDKNRLISGNYENTRCSIGSRCPTNAAAAEEDSCLRSLSADGARRIMPEKHPGAGKNPVLSAGLLA